MKISNKELIQSYIMTTAKYDFSVYEKRILYRVIESLQPLTAGKKLNTKYSMQENLFGHMEMTYDLSLFLIGGEDKNYRRIKDALSSLRDKAFEYEDDRIWEYIGIIESPVISKYNGKATFTLNKKVYEAFLDFSKGFRKYELATAMSFESTYSMRFYELFSKKQTPIIYSIDSLKEMFKLEEKYTRISDFVRYVIETAKKELDEKSPYSFDYVLKKTGRKITHIRFKPYVVKENQDQELLNKKGIKELEKHIVLDEQKSQLLMERFGFTERGLQNNASVLYKAFSHPKFIQEWCGEIASMVTDFDIQNIPGFFINQIKKRLNE